MYNHKLGDDHNKIAVLPNQKVSSKTKKSPKWQKDCIDYFVSASGSDWNKRKSKASMEELYNFYNSYITDAEIKQTLDPLGVDRESGVSEGERNAFSFYDILAPRFNTLYGEFLKRNFEVRAYAINPDVINEKDRMFRAEVYQAFSTIAQQETQDEEQLKAKLAELDNLLKNDLQTAHEQMANSILRVLQSDSNFNHKYNNLKGFENYQIVGEIIYKFYNIGNDLFMRPIDSPNFTVLGLTESNWVEDGTAWIERRYLTPYEIIKEFGQDLTDHEIRLLLSQEEGLTYNPLMPNDLPVVKNEKDIPYILLPNDLINKDGYLITDASQLMGANNVGKNGTIMVTHVEWITLKKIGLLLYLDEFGEQQKTWVPEEYEVLEELGETVEWMWVHEVMEGTLIGNEIYKRVRPLPVQMRKMSNPFIVKPSYIGYINSKGKGIAQSRLEKLVPYQRLFNVYMNKLVDLWTRNLGKVGIVDMSRIPSSMDTTEWYIWLKRFGLLFENSFEFGKEGIAKGQLAGHMQPGNRTVDMSIASEISEAINVLNWIEQMVDKISAVPAPRQGNLRGDEGLGVTQQAIVNSNHQTEFDFYIMDTLETRLFETALEYAKALWKDEKLKKQYLLDDLSTYLLEVDGALLNEAEYGIKITNSSKMNDLQQAMNNLAYPAMQSGLATLTDVASIILSSTPSEIHTKLKQAEETRNKQQQQQQEQQAQMQKQQIDSQMQLEQMKHGFEMEKLTLEMEYRLQIESLKASAQYSSRLMDQNSNGIDDEVEITMEEMKAETAEKKIKSDEYIAKLKMANDLKIASKKQTAIKK